MADQSSENKVLYKLGIWFAEPADPGKEESKRECYSPGEIFIKAKEDELCKVPRFLGEGNIPDSENLIRLIDVVSQEMVKSLGCKRVYLVSLESEGKDRLHFRLLPRYESDKGFLNDLDPEINNTNDGFALMAHWRKQFLLKEGRPFEKLCKAHEEAIKKIEEELHKLALTSQD